MIKFLENVFLTKKETLINSEVIQKDFETELKELMDKISVSVGNNSEIEALYEEVKLFNLENLDLKEKIEKLKNLGLVNTPSVKVKEKELEEAVKDKHKSIEDKKAEIKSLEEEQEKIKHYALKYPSYKYIPKKEFLNILNKYNLVMGEAFMYSREIPDRAVNIVSSFKKEIEESEVVLNLAPDYGGRQFGCKFEVKSVSKIKELKDSVENGGYYDSNGYAVRKQEMLKMYNDKLENFTYKLSKFKMVAPKDHFEVPKLKLRDVVRDTWNYIEEKLETEVSICTTQDGIITFDLKELNKGLGEFRKVLDPIAVLCVNDFCNKSEYDNSHDYQHVFDGVIILDAWDEEANIPEIKNNLLN